MCVFLGDTRDAMLRHFEEWAPKFACGSSVRRMLRDSSCVRGGPHRLVTSDPGANLAMTDGADLGLAFAKAKTDSELLEHVRAYEEKKGR